MHPRLLVALAVWLVAQGASATSIAYLQDLREIHIEESASTHGSGYSETVQPDSPFAYFARSVYGGETFASQSSAMNEVQMTASGEAWIYIDIFTNNPLAYSTFHIVFEITETTPFSLTGSIAREEFSGASFADASLRLSSGGMDLYALALPGGFDPVALPVSASGELAPGVYELYVSALADQNHMGRATYDIKLSILPEPAAGALLLAGLAAIAALGRQTARSA